MRRTSTAEASGWRKYLTVGAALLMVTLAGACAGEEKPTIRLADTEWESLWVNNAIAEFIIENAYGYAVETEKMTSTTMQTWLPGGLVDIQMEGWEQNSMDWYNEEISKGTIENLGMTYEGGPQFFLIPRWVHERHGIDTVFEMKDHWELFRDPDDPTKGIFINCIIDWVCAEVNVVKLEAYGLTDYYNIITPGSAEALDAALAEPQERGEPVFGYYWAPSAIMGLYDWYILEEPPYGDTVWEKVTAARDNKSLRPIDEACAYPTLPINKLTWSGLKDKAPEVYALLKKMNIGLEPLNKTLAWAKENDIQDYSEAAVYYLRNFENRWSGWMPQDKVQKVKEALADIGG
jgi:glycine betaine/proline transport system substrate-binding protein